MAQKKLWFFVVAFALVISLWLRGINASTDEYYQDDETIETVGLNNDEATDDSVHEFIDTTSSQSDSIEDGDVEDVPFDTPLEPPKPLPDPTKRPSVFDLFTQLPPFELQHWWSEILILLFLAAYGLQFWLGRDQNAVIAKAWIEVNSDMFRRNFVHLGDGQGHLLIKDSPSDYIFYASGRIHCRSLTAKLDLKKRHDLIALVLDLFVPSYDTVTFQIEMNDMPPFVLAILPKAKVPSMRKDCYDLGTFTKVVTIEGVPSDFVVLSESLEIAEAVVTSSFIKKVFQQGTFFRGLHFSDQPKVRPASLKALKTDVARTLCWTFRLPATSQMRTIAELQTLVVNMIDTVVESSILSKEGRVRANKAREIAHADLLKKMRKEVEEVAQERKAEKARAEKEKYDKMSAEDKAKYDELKYKRDLKKNGGMFGRSKVVRA